MNKHIEITMLRPATNKETYHTISDVGIESEIIVKYGITFDEKNQHWVLGQSNGKGPTGYS